MTLDLSEREARLISAALSTKIHILQTLEAAEGYAGNQNLTGYRKLKDVIDDAILRF